MDKFDNPNSENANLLRFGFMLEFVTLSWNVVAVFVLAILAFQSSSIALAGFGFDSLIEIGASIVVIWELRGVGEARQKRALKLIGSAFGVLAVYMIVVSTTALVQVHRSNVSVDGMVWTVSTAILMFALARGKFSIGKRLDNPVILAEGKVTLVDGLLALAVFVGLVLNASFGLWWADAVIGFVIAGYSIKEVLAIFRG